MLFHFLYIKNTEAPLSFTSFFFLVFNAEKIFKVIHNQECFIS